jgi:hypothetical protein
MREQGRPAAWVCLLTPGLLDYWTLTLTEQTGNVIEKKGRLRLDSRLPTLNSRNQRVDDEVGQVNEHNERQQRKADG